MTHFYRTHCGVHFEHQEVECSLGSLGYDEIVATYFFTEDKRHLSLKDAKDMIEHQKTLEWMASVSHVDEKKIQESTSAPL